MVLLRGRVRFRIIDSPCSAVIKSFVSDYVADGSTIVTDGLKSYEFLKELNVIHKPYTLSAGTLNEESNLEHVHLVISLLKRWLLGTHQGAVTPSRLSGYLDEFAFRFNRRLSTHRGKLFYRLMQQVVTTKARPTKDLYMHKAVK